uniref:Uncharacterized protein n=1 Tax=viral metagenome TaxID=1070528 RepID=A0A6M3JVF8_9ZZZZ
MSTPTTEIKKRLEPIEENWATDDSVMSYGTIAFVSTGTTVELDVPQASVDCILCMPKTVTYGANDQLSSDGVVTSSAVTIARNAAGTSVLTVYYLVIGPIAQATS